MTLGSVWAPGVSTANIKGTDGIGPGGSNANGNTLIHSSGALTDLIRTTRLTTAHTKTFQGKNMHYHQRVDELIAPV